MKPIAFLAALLLSGVAFAHIPNAIALPTPGDPVVIVDGYHGVRIVVDTASIVHMGSMGSAIEMRVFAKSRYDGARKQWVKSDGSRILFNCVNGQYKMLDYFELSAKGKLVHAIYAGGPIGHWQKVNSGTPDAKVWWGVCRKYESGARSGKSS